MAGNYWSKRGFFRSTAGRWNPSVQISGVLVKGMRAGEIHEVSPSKVRLCLGASENHLLRGGRQGWCSPCIWERQMKTEDVVLAGSVKLMEGATAGPFTRWPGTPGAQVTRAPEGCLASSSRRPPRRGYWGRAALRFPTALNRAYFPNLII